MQETKEEIKTEKAAIPIKEIEEKTAEKELSPKEKQAIEIKKKIDEERKTFHSIVDEIKRKRRRLSYKKAEQAALGKLVVLNAGKTKDIGYLRRMKERLEFRVATEAGTLIAEKELIRKINDVNAELQKALASFRLRKKAEMAGSDVINLGKEIDEQEKKIVDVNKRLDELYSSLRLLTGFKRKAKGPERRETKGLKPLEISLEDMAIMKNKKEEDVEVDSN